VRFTHLLVLASTSALAFSLLGCSSDEPPGGGSCIDYQPPAGFDALTPAVSFSRDVMPVFKQSCAFSTCHGSTTGPANGVFLGDDAARVHKALVGARSGELATMNFVTASDPRQSYLMRKMDASQCALDAQCTGGSCQGSMPKNEDPLPVDKRDIVRRWIAQGAKND
jgi:hypothetical protein